MRTQTGIRTTLLAGVAAGALLGGNALAQDAPAHPKHHHRHAAPDGIAARLDKLERVINEQQAQIQSLKAQLGHVPVEAEATPPAQPQVTAQQFQALQAQVAQQQATAAATPKPPPDQAVVSLGRNGRPLISSPDGRYTFSPRALVQADVAGYSKDVVAGMPIKSTGENFRRAQIGFQGKFAGDFQYKFIYDFGGTNGDETYQAYINKSGALATTGAGSGPHIQQAWVSYQGFLDPFSFQIGALAVPANLGDATASDDLLFNERPSGSQLSRSLGGDDGRTAAGFVGNGQWWFASGFLAGDTVGKGALMAPSATQGNFVGRVAFFPWYDPATNFNLHLGGNYTDVFKTQETTNASDITTTGIAFSDRPELRVDNFTLLNTGSINAKSAYTAGIEAAVSWGPVLLEAEDFWYGADRKIPTPGVTNPNFSAWYVDASWVLTGEFRKYVPATASYTRPSPANSFDPGAGAWGAWEVAGRYSDTDLDYDITSPVSGDRVFGGHQKVWTAGLNFYPNDILKFMLDWQDVNVDNVGKLGNDTHYNTISLRSQVSF